MIPVNANDPNNPNALPPALAPAGGFTGGGSLPPGTVPRPGGSSGSSGGSSTSTPAGGGYQPPTSTATGPKDCPPGVPPQVCAMMAYSGGAFGKQVEGKLSDLLNQGSRFTPEIMQQLAAGSKQTTEAQTARDVEAVNQDAAARGMFGTGFAAAEAGAARRAGADRLAQDVRTQKLEKVKTDFEDKLAGLDRAQKYLDSLRAATSQFNATAADRERNEAAIRLGYAQLAQQKSQFASQLESNKELLAMSLNSQEFLAGLRLQLGLI
jgi:hypothetical protein